MYEDRRWCVCECILEHACVHLPMHNFYGMFNCTTYMHHASAHFLYHYMFLLPVRFSISIVAIVTLAAAYSCEYETTNTS